MGKPLSFDYRPRLNGWVLAAIPLCGLGMWIYLNKAIRARAGEIVYDSRGAVPEWFLWALSGGFTVFLLLGIASVVAAVKPARKLIITETGITCPKNPFARDVTIPFSKVSAVTLKSAVADYIEIRHSRGKVSIPSSFLPYGAFTGIRDALDGYRRRSAAKAEGSSIAGSRAD